MDTWIVALAGIAGTVAGAVIAIVGNQLSARQQDREHRDERLWQTRLELYSSVFAWLAAIDERLHDVHYTFGDYVEAVFQSPDDEWPTPVLTKRAEYRDYVHPTEWETPKPVGDTLLVHLRALTPPALIKQVEDAGNAAVRFMNEASSIGVNTIKKRNRTEGDVTRSRSVIDALYMSWLIDSNKLLNGIRSELDHSAVAVPLDKQRLQNWDTISSNKPGHS